MTLLTTQTMAPLETPFDRFWAAWPQHRRKRDKKTALARWNREKLDDKIEHVLAVLKIDKAKWAEDDNKYVPAPEVWIHKRKWDCEIEDIEPKRSKAVHELAKQMVVEMDMNREAKEAEQAFKAWKDSLTPSDVRVILKKWKKKLDTNELPPSGLILKWEWKAKREKAEPKGD